MKREPNITRHAHGWQFRRECRGELRTKWFADRQYGGKREALHAARKHRDGDLRRRRGRVVARRPVGCIIRVKRTDSRGCVIDEWRGTVRYQNRSRTTTRSVRRHGSREARRQVKAWLELQCRLIRGDLEQRGAKLWG